MEAIQEKENFLQHEYAEMLTALDTGTPPKWGKMNVQQMIEHMSDYVRIANGKTHFDIITQEENIPKMQAFLMSDKQMRENTPNPLLPDEPPAVRHATKAAAVQELKGELVHFFEVYDNGKNDKVTPNPFFGMLNYEMQVRLLYKHAIHHLRQFGAVE